MVTNVYFVRHAQSDTTIKEDMPRPLTDKGFQDTKRVTKALKEFNISRIFSSPYQRAVDTVKDLANSLGQTIILEEDFRERHVGEWVEDFKGYSRRQWEDFDYKLANGESLRDVQYRNISALHKVIKEHEGMNVVIGTHGTALSTIINYYDPSFGYDSFWSIIDKMPYIVRFQFEGNEWMGVEVIELENLNLNILWKESSQDLQSFLASDIQMSISPMDSGLEADVFKISTPDQDYVLKVWNRDSKPDISFQYKALEMLHHLGIAVSQPVGWGVDENYHQVLLTTFDGTPVHKVNNKKLIEIANLLIAIHKLTLDKLDGISLPTYSFVHYFFPGIEQQPDLKELLDPLVESLNIEPTCLIHGDYHLGNILEANGKYYIIDWTNLQLGDPRYDIAWSNIIIWIYVSEQNYMTYRSVFMADSIYSDEELEKFEAIACLRWILLNRIAKLPNRDNTISIVKSIIKNNKYLKEGLI